MAYEYKCKILRIVDGDTVDVDIDLGFGVWMHKERVRIVGLDTPESRTRDKEEKVFGLAAKEYLKGLLPIGSMQIIKTQKDKTGKFGRILGDFIIDPPLNLGNNKPSNKYNPSLGTFNPDPAEEQ